MIILKYAVDVKTHLKKASQPLGFVPTMGALHEGHMSLLQNSKEKCATTVCSIFINPTQFNNPDDFDKYPVTIEKDIYSLEKNLCNILYLPHVSDIYPDGIKLKKPFDLGYLETILEGKYRPGHFQGVCQVVKRLLEIVQPDVLFLGQKDYQQCMVIKKLLHSEKMNIEVEICPTLREKNGLAMSSRNLRLSEDEKELASEIYKTLTGVRDNLKPGPVDHLKNNAIRYLESKNIKPDYIEIADAASIKPVNNWDGEKDLVILAAVFIGDVRLIDNILVTV